MTDCDMADAVLFADQAIEGRGYLDGRERNLARCFKSVRSALEAERAEVAELRANIKERIGDNRDGSCPYCGEMTSQYAGNPGMWPMYYPDPDQWGTGKGRYHHMKCLLTKLKDAEAAEARARTLAEALDRYGVHEVTCSASERTDDAACDCGLMAALASVAEQPEDKET